MMVYNSLPADIVLEKGETTTFLTLQKKKYRKQGRQSHKFFKNVTIGGIRNLFSTTL